MCVLEQLLPPCHKGSEFHLVFHFSRYSCRVFSFKEERLQKTTNISNDMPFFKSSKQTLANWMISRSIERHLEGSSVYHRPSISFMIRMHDSREAIVILHSTYIPIFVLIPEDGVVNFKKQKWDPWLTNCLQDYLLLLVLVLAAFLVFVNKVGNLAYL